jgi:hypothetical protein
LQSPTTDRSLLLSHEIFELPYVTYLTSIPTFSRSIIEKHFLLWYKNEDDFDKNVSVELVLSIRDLTIGQRYVEGMRASPPRPLRPSPPSDEEEYPSFRVYHDFHHFVEMV